MIEDDPNLCRGWADVFDLLGYHLDAFTSGLDALSQPEKIREADLLITDFYLPDLNGVDLARARVRVPVTSWLRIPLGSGFAVMVAHSQRHLAQAQIRKSVV